MQLESLSQQLQNINNTVPHINAGGCGEFALMLGKHLTKHNIKFKYVLFSYNNNLTILERIRNFNNFESRIKNDMGVLSCKNYDICHIMIYYKGKFIDSTGVYNSIDETKWTWCKISAIITEDILAQWCKNGRWNNMFDKDYIPTLKKLVRKINILN